MNEFQDRLEDLLMENNLSRLQLANNINISSTTINGYFNNDYYPEISIAIKMADYFNCSLNFLFGLTDKRDKLNENSNSFIVNFENLRKRNKLSIAGVLKELNMSEYNYYRWKAGKFPKTVNLITIAKYFDVSVDYLIGRVKLI